MEKRLYSGILIFFCILSISAASYFFIKAGNLERQARASESALREVMARVNMPIDATKAVDIAKNDSEFIEFSNQYFRDPTLRAELVSLQSDKELGYVWKIELIERKCACGGKATLNSMCLYVNPESGNVLKRERYLAISEDEYAKKGCRAACHST